MDIKFHIFNRSSSGECDVTSITDRGMEGSWKFVGSKLALPAVSPAEQTVCIAQAHVQCLFRLRIYLDIGHASANMCDVKRNTAGSVFHQQPEQQSTKWRYRSISVVTWARLPLWRSAASVMSQGRRPEIKQASDLENKFRIVTYFYADCYVKVSSKTYWIIIT